MTETATRSYYAPTRLDIQELEAAHGGALTLDEARDLAAALGAMARGHQWWIGDLEVYAEEHFGEEAAQLEAELGLAPATASNYRYVAVHVAASRRREDLTWSHHAEVARLAAADQTAALELAHAEGWNVRQLRDYVALTWPAPRQDELFPDSGLSDRENEDVQRRLERISLALDAGDIETEDVRWLLELARRLTRNPR